MSERPSLAAPQGMKRLTQVQGSLSPQVTSFCSESSRAGEDQGEAGPGLLLPGPCRNPGVLRQPQLLCCLPAWPKPTQEKVSHKLLSSTTWRRAAGQRREL